MSTVPTTRLECRCEQCGHEWTSRTDKVPYQCPRCLKRRHYWNKSEEDAIEVLRPYTENLVLENFKRLISDS